MPGRQYEGTVHAVLGQVTEGQREEVTGIAAGTQRYGTVNVLVEAPDGSARPGMQAAVRILPGAPPAAEHDSRDAPPGTTDAHCLLLRGIVEAGRGALLRAPVNGRADWVAPAGTVVASGDLVIRFEPGLRRDSQAADRDHEQRVECTRRAAELALQLAEETVPLRVAAAQAALDVAELAREELLARPSEVERVEAANAVDDARRRLRLAEEEHGDYGDLAARGLASGMDVRRSELAVARAQAVLAQAEAERTRVLRGAPAQDVAVADADVALARTALERLQARAEADIEAARAALVAAEKDQADLCRQAEERRRTEECSDILAPCAGVVVGSMPEGAQVAQGAYAVAVAELESVQVHASLDEADYFRVAPGMRATVRVAGLPGAPFAGRVTGVREWPDPPFWVQEQADTGKRRMGKQFQVVIVPEGRFPTMLGMSAEVRVFTAEPRAGVAGTADVHERVTLEGGA